MFFFTEAKAKAIDEPHKIESYAAKEYNKAEKDPPLHGLHEAIPDAFTGERDVLNSAKQFLKPELKSGCNQLFCDFVFVMF